MENKDWTACAIREPEGDGTYLGHVPSSKEDPVWPVLYEGGRWYDCDGSARVVVTHWQAWPDPPCAT